MKNDKIMLATLIVAILALIISIVEWEHRSPPSELLRMIFSFSSNGDESLQRERSPDQVAEDEQLGELSIAVLGQPEEYEQDDLIISSNAMEIGVMAIEITDELLNRAITRRVASDSIRALRFTGVSAAFSNYPRDSGEYLVSLGLTLIDLSIFDSSPEESTTDFELIKQSRNSLAEVLGLPTKLECHYCI